MKLLDFGLARLTPVERPDLSQVSEHSTLTEPDGNVSAVDGDANSQAVIDALGFAAGTSGYSEMGWLIQSESFLEA